MSAPTSLRGVVLLALATLRALIVILRVRPRVTFATGGYVSIPAVIASWLLRVPIVIFLPDVVPGRAIAWLLPLARRVAVSTDDAVAYLPKGKSVVTGYPVRPVFRETSRESARSRLGLAPDEKVVCVFGGSLGARNINEALAGCLENLLRFTHVLHISGEQRFGEATQAALDLPEALRARYRLFPYLHDRDMADAVASADLAVCRSGASTIGELPFLGTPAILVPLPERKVHQWENADYLARRGAAVVVPDDCLRDRLEPTVRQLLGDQKRIAEMRTASRQLARPDADRHIAHVISEEAR